MHSLFETTAVKDITDRINKLTPLSQRQWGQMDVSQMLGHCHAALEVAAGKKSPPRIFIGRILGPIVKPNFISDRPFKKNVPTDKSFVITGERNFEKEKEQLIKLINQFAAGGPEKCTHHPHSFFGKLTPDEWSKGMYKHLDHHLKQFGV